MNVGAAISRPLSASFVRGWRAANGRPYEVNQKFATSEDFNCSCNLSAIRAMNSLFVGLPFVFVTVTVVPTKQPRRNTL